MPTIKANGIDLYYEIHGSGEPLVWIGGLGAHIGEIPHLIESYSRHYQLIVFESRGCGRSEKPDGEYSMAGFADDTAALLDALGCESAFVYGSSMGGMIAQELVLRHPRTVRALVLGCTTPGALRGERPSAETVQQLIRNQSLTGDEATEAGWKLGYSEQYIAAHRDEMLARSRASNGLGAPKDSYIRQVLAAAKHDTYDRLSEISCPVLIIHGAADLMMPVGNAHLLKRGIPHAELAILEGVGHGYNLEAQDEADAIILDFLRSHSHVPEGAASAIR